MRRIAVIAAALGVTALVSAGVTLGVLRLQARTNTQEVNLRPGVTLTQESAIVQAAAKAKPAVVSVITHAQNAPVVRGSGYLATADGYIVTTVDVVAGTSGMTVLVPNDSHPHDARLVDYDCATGVAVIKIDQVTGLPTLAFADPTVLTQGQVVVAVSGPADGGASWPGYVTAMHRDSQLADPSNAGHGITYSDTIETSAGVDANMSGGPLLNVQAQVVALAVDSPSSGYGVGLNVADIQDDVQQILQTGQLSVASIGATTEDVTPDSAVLSGQPEGTRLTSVDKGGPASNAGLHAGDVITQVDEVHIDASHPLSLLLRSRFHASQRVTVTYTRGSTSTQAELTLGGEHPACV